MFCFNVVSLAGHHGTAVIVLRLRDTFVVHVIVYLLQVGKGRSSVSSLTCKTETSSKNIYYVSLM